MHKFRFFRVSYSNWKNGFHFLAGQKPKRGKFLKADSVSVVGAAHKKILADITNKGQPKHHPAPPLLPPSTDVSVDLILQVYIHNNVIKVLWLLLIDWWLSLHSWIFLICFSGKWNDEEALRSKKVIFYLHFVSNFMPFYLQSM